MSVEALGTQRHHPVVELFGPTVQGEGPDAGLPCLFVRFGGCDYRCCWCDSMHAVDPLTVRQTARRLTAGQIVADLGQCGADLRGLLVVLSGGNPVMHELGPLVDLLHDRGARVSVETQGSLWADWLGGLERLVVSPKPPSSGMATPSHRAETARFMAAVNRAGVMAPRVCLKVVCFDDADIDFAFAFREEFCGADGARLPLYLSSGNDVVAEVSVQAVADRYRWLCQTVAADPRARDCKVLPQLHVIAWGNEKGR